MEFLKEILKIVVSWPMVAIVMVILLRKPIKSLVDRLILSEAGKAKIGPFEVELGKLAESREKVMSDFSQLNQAMAETRLLSSKSQKGCSDRFLLMSKEPECEIRLKNLKS
jgi:hypothetical protein